MKLKKYDFFPLPNLKILQSMIQPNWIQLTESVKIMYDVSRESAYTRKSLGYEGVKAVDGDIYIDFNNYPLRDRAYRDINIKRLYIVDQIFESVYWNLDMFLNDFQKAKILAALSGDSVQSWVQYLGAFKPTLNSKSTKLIDFVKYGLRILKTNALYENFEKRW